MNDYRAVRLFLKFGPALAALATAALWALTGWALVTGLIGIPVAVFGAMTGLIIGFLMLVFVDLTRLIAEMLIPR